MEVSLVVCNDQLMQSLNTQMVVTVSGQELLSMTCTVIDQEYRKDLNLHMSILHTLTEV